MTHASTTPESGESEQPTANETESLVSLASADEGIAESEVLEERPSQPKSAPSSTPKMRRSRFRNGNKSLGRAQETAFFKKPPPIEPRVIPLKIAGVGAQTPKALSDAIERVQRLVDEARLDRQRDTAAYRGPGVPREPTRRDLLLRAARAETRAPGADVHANELRQMDAGVARIATEIVENPLWIAADYLERNTKLENVTDCLRDDERIKQADRAYARAEKALVAAKTELERFESGRTSWARKLDKALPVRWRKQTRLHAQMALASQNLVYGKVERNVTEANVRAELEMAIGERNGAALARQNEARGQRDDVERHLREALVHRHIGERLWQPDRAPAHLKAAPVGQALEYAGVCRLGPFDFQEFRGEGRAYLADALDVRETVAQLDLARGDRVTVREGAFGELSLDVQARGDVWSGARSITGQLVEIDREGDTVRGLKLCNAETKQVKWVRPREGNDLGTELSPALLRSLVLDDTILIEGRSMYVRPARARSQDRGR